MRKHIGGGTFGDVYNIDDNYALKVYKSSFPRCDYIREIFLLNLLKDHENIINIYALEPSKLQIKIELCDTTLSDMITEKNENIHNMKIHMFELAKTMKCMNDNDIFHRDLKPSNILLKNGKIKICDFGISKYVYSVHENMSDEIFSIWYRPPEYLLLEIFDMHTNHVNLRSAEVYSLGRVFLDMYLGMEDNILQGEDEYEQMVMNLSIFDHNDFVYDIYDINKDIIVHIDHTTIINKLGEHREFDKSNELCLDGVSSFESVIHQRINSSDIVFEDLLYRMLHPNPIARITFENILLHKFFSDVVSVRNEFILYKPKQLKMPIYVYSNIKKKMYCDTIQFLLVLVDYLNITSDEYILFVICAIKYGLQLNDCKNLNLIVCASVYVFEQLLCVKCHDLDCLIEISDDSFTEHELKKRVFETIKYMPEIDISIISRIKKINCDYVNIYNQLELIGFNFDHTFCDIIRCCEYINLNDLCVNNITIKKFNDLNL